MPDGGARPGKARGLSGWISGEVRHMLGRCLDALEFLGATRKDVPRMILSLLLAYGAGELFTYLKLPLPWILGPLTLALVMTIFNRPLTSPRFMVQPVRALLGVAVGASFTPAILGQLPGTAFSIAIMLPYMAFVTFLGMVMLNKLAGFDKPTAFFSAAPGGLADMILMAEEAGANLRHVTLVQAARLCAIVFLVPFWLQYGEGKPLGGAAPQTIYTSELMFLDALLILAMAWGGWRFGERIGLLGASIVGPMMVSGLAHGFGLTTVKVPVEGLILAQITVGIVIGANFKGVTFREFVTVLSWGGVFALLLLAAATAMALATTGITGIDATTLLLAYAPGGQNEMAILAIILGVDVAVVALHHFSRVFLVIIGAQFVFKAHKDWKKS